MNKNSQHPTEAKASSVPVEESPFAESQDRDEAYEDPESADPGQWVGFSGHRLCLSAPSNSSDIGARSGAYSFVDLNHHFEMEDMLLLCPLPLLRVEQLRPCYSLIVTSGYPNQANCKYYTSVGGSMTTGLDGLLDIRQKNDMLNALRFLESFAVWPLKLLRIYFPMSFDKRREEEEEPRTALCLSASKKEVGRTISWSTHKAWEMPFPCRLPIRYSH
ncbi:hypothetical protein LIER_22687 [Lithospermum erythrorhizon]|uniref:Uncharacterized protein n=1 Tax=Lithospermum erythrorhizon TaxID=34254 RepID=A0AAV3QUQ7_LITER